MLMMTVIIKMKVDNCGYKRGSLQYNPDQKDTDYDEHRDACYVRP